MAESAFFLSSSSLSEARAERRADCYGGVAAGAGGGVALLAALAHLGNHRDGSTLGAGGGVDSLWGAVAKDKSGNGLGGCPTLGGCDVATLG